MAPRFYIAVISADHVESAMKRGVFACSHGKQAPVEQIRQHDRFAFYSPKSHLGRGSPVQAFTALGTITDDAPFQMQWEGANFTAWVRKAEYDKGLLPAKARLLVENLKFISNKTYWGMAFRRGFFEINENDFQLIYHAMKEAEHG